MTFDEEKYKAAWAKQNMKLVTIKVKKEFKEEYANACDTLGITQAERLKETMQQVIKEAEQQKKDLESN